MSRGAGLLAVLAVLMGCSSSMTEPTTSPGEPAAGDTSAPALATAVPSPRASEPLGGPQPIPVSTLAPVTLTIPAIGVRTQLDRLVRQRNGELQRPPAWLRPGWYVGGSVPGERGPAVIAGHVDSPSGPAVFWRLRELAPGDAVVVTRSDASTARFTVTRTQQFSQAAFPTDLVYGPTPARELRLITCGGTYDHRARRYRDNIVVFAVAADDDAATGVGSPGQ